MMFKGTTEAKYKFGSLRRLLCCDNNSTDLFKLQTGSEDFKENRRSSGDSPVPLRWRLC